MTMGRLDPQYVETVLNEKKVRPQDIEMAQAHKAFRASTNKPTTVRYWRRALGQLGRFLVSISERPSRASNTEI